jgi:hypothetical protein
LSPAVFSAFRSDSKVMRHLALTGGLGWKAMLTTATGSGLAW